MLYLGHYAAENAMCNDCFFLPLRSSSHPGVYAGIKELPSSIDNEQNMQGVFQVVELTDDPEVLNIAALCYYHMGSYLFT